MKDANKDALEELQKIEQKTQIIGKLSERLEKLENQMREIAQSATSTSSSIDKNDFQKIVTKVTTLRELIDKIEIEIDQLDSRITDIESLRFKHRTES
ncbi:hypothetical protein EU527_11045 [Candidatus Thorarchaeota archaeon]|nr:MAG: hypothetical protein EU527_11045 [Candidatus Thorarchaeota archaeon]